MTDKIKPGRCNKPGVYPLQIPAESADKIKPGRCNKPGVYPLQIPAIQQLSHEFNLPMPDVGYQILMTAARALKNLRNNNMLGAIFDFNMLSLMCDISSYSKLFEDCVSTKDQCAVLCDALEKQVFDGLMQMRKSLADNLEKLRKSGQDGKSYE